MVAARASAVCASISASRMWMSEMRCGSVAVSASASSAARSVSAAITVSSTLSEVAGRFLRDGADAGPPVDLDACRHRALIWPRISLNRVVLPLPFLPTKPALAPSGSTSEAPSNRGRPWMR